MAFDIFQQALLLSRASNLVNDVTGTQTSLQKALQLALQYEVSVLPGWEVAWGPVVWKDKPDEDTTGPDNSWYIAYHPRLEFEDGSVHPTYLIAVAGTPVKSQYAWTEENFAVNSVVDFRAWVAGGIQLPPTVVPAAQIVPGTPYIAKGTVHGVYLVLNTPAPEGTASPGSTLLDFISNVDMSEDTRFITTGHSLGGALSPSLALALVLSGVIPSQNTLTYPTAGPSPGNRGFTDLFAATFPARKYDSARSYQGWNLNLVNTLDIVPQAWSVQKALSPSQNLGNIPPIYGKPVVRFVRGITLVFAVHTLRSGALYFPLPSQYFTGSPPSAPPKTVGEFLQLAVPQHEQAYLDELGIVATPLNSEVLGSGITLKTKDEIRFNYPVIAGFEWAREHPAEAEREILKVEGESGDAEAKALLGDSD